MTIQEQIQVLRTKLSGRGEVRPQIREARETLLKAWLLAPLNPIGAQRNIDDVKSKLSI